MKKRLITILLLIVVLLFTACGNKVQSGEMVKNGSFESETGTKVSEWALERYDVAPPIEYYQVVQDVTAPDGSNVIKIESPEYNDARFIQTVSVNPNSVYRLSAWVKTGDIDKRSADSGANICFMQTHCKSDFVKSDADWQEIVIYGKTDSKTKEATIGLRLGYYSADAKGTVYFDKVSLTEVDSVPDGEYAMSMAKFEFSSSNDSSGEDKNTATSSDIQAKTTIIGIVLFALFALFLIWAKKALNFKMRDAYILIGISLVVRLIASCMYVGFKVDINCFASWGERMAAEGLSGFYAEGYFCDYPPLYMIVLGLLSNIGKLFSLDLQAGAGLMLLKLPAVLSDCIAAILIMHISKKHVGERMAALLGIGYALLPTAILNSAIWGQVDSVLVLFLLLTFWLIDEDKFGPSIIVYTVGLLFKPQAILLGPVMLLGAAREFSVIFASYKRGDKKDGSKRLLSGFGFLFASVLLFFLLSVIMQNDQSGRWLIDKYLTTLGSYDYATLSSFGLMGLLGGQWVPSDTTLFLGISYGTLGTVLLALVIAATVAMFVIRLMKKEAMLPKWLWLLGAFMLAGAVTVSTRTHERYMFPVIMMLIMCYVRFKDIRFLFMSFGYALLNYINVACLLFLYEGIKVYFVKEDAVFIIGSLLTVALFIYQAYVTVRLVLNENSAVTEEKSNNKQVKKNASYSAQASGYGAVKDEGLRKLFERRNHKLPKVTRWDIIICVAITLIYAVVAFSGLGDTKSPETYWYTATSKPYMVADLGKVTQGDSIGYKANNGSFNLYVSEDGESFTLYESVKIKENKWEKIEKPFNARYIKVEALTPIRMEELVFFNGNESLEVASTYQQVVPVDNNKAFPENLFDAQDAFGKETEDIKTFLEGNESIIVTLEKPVDVTLSRVHFGGNGEITMAVDASLLGDQASEEPWNDMVAFTSYDGGWAYAQPRGEFDDSILTDKVLIKNPDKSSIGEILFLENQVPVKVIGITDLEGNAVTDHTELFDESEIAIKQFESIAKEKWIVSTVADHVTIDFGEVKNIDRGYYMTSLCAGNFEVYYSNDLRSWSNSGTVTVEKSNLYYWHTLTPPDEARYVLVTASSQFLELLEMGFFESDTATQPIAIQTITAANIGEKGGQCLFDEQTLVPYEGPTYMNSMYFDEIYHARTGLESSRGLSIYEWTHPPLGKDMISWCISLMGMNPFAWRFAGTLAGVVMVPAMFFLGLLMFKKTSWATVAALLMALDGMHFVQTRIATIDSFGVLFIILMFLFMYWYYSLSFYDTPLKKTFVPLGLCGLSFGLGAASKWICLYAGAGLAVIFFITLFRRYSEYRTAVKNLNKVRGNDQEYLKHIKDTFTLNTCYTLLFCILVFIIIPIIIYCLSYYPYWNAVDETRPWYKIILDNQRDMFNYHSKLEATHPYQSDWYTWPIMEEPMFYYAGPSTKTTMSAIYAFGNPFVWYAGLIAAVWGIIIFFKRFFGDRVAVYTHIRQQKGFFSLFTAGDEDTLDITERDNRTVLFLLLGVVCNLLPWVGISRCIFIYHYFATVPFIMLFTVYILRNVCRKYLKTGTVATIVLIVLAFIAFIMFKPLWTGTSVSRQFVETWLRWMPSWFAYWFN